MAFFDLADRFQKVILAVGASLLAQWPEFATPGVLPTSSGEADMTAPAPRPREGKPDFTGLRRNTLPRVSRSWVADINGSPRWTIRRRTLSPVTVRKLSMLDEELIEFICNENERDAVHLVGQ